MIRCVINAFCARILTYLIIHLLYIGFIDGQLLPEDDQDRSKHVGSYDKSRVKNIHNFNISALVTSLVAWWSELLTTNHEVPGSIPGSTMCVFP